MKRNHALTLVVAVCLSVAAPVRAQMGMNLFKKPNIADIFKPVVGKGGVYETQRSDKKEDPARIMEMTIVGKDTVDGQEAFWFEVAHDDEKKGQPSYAKMLVTRDFQFHKMVFQQPGQQAMEMPFHPGANDKAKQHREEELEKWHQVGTETITVPAGTFSCVHWQKDDGKGDVWVSDKVSPFGMVKMVNEHETMTLTKIISDAKDHITGPVKTFDPEAMKRQMMEQYQQKPKQ
jgi:hypothetical protein